MYFANISQTLNIYLYKIKGLIIKKEIKDLSDSTYDCYLLDLMVIQKILTIKNNSRLK